MPVGRGPGIAGQYVAHHRAHGPCARATACGVEGGRQVPAAVLEPHRAHVAIRADGHVHRVIQPRDVGRRSPSPCWRRGGTRRSPIRRPARARRTAAQPGGDDHDTALDGRVRAVRCFERHRAQSGVPADQRGARARASAARPGPRPPRPASRRNARARRWRRRVAAGAASALPGAQTQRVVGVGPQLGEPRRQAAVIECGERTAVQAAAAHLRPWERGPVDEQHRGSGSGTGRAPRCCPPGPPRPRRHPTSAPPSRRVLRHQAPPARPV